MIFELYLGSFIIVTRMANKYDFLPAHVPFEEASNVERKKYLQKLGILKTLYFEGPKTNTNICEKFKISSPTSIRLLNQLIEEGLVMKKGRGKSVGGRKPDLYRLKGGSFYVMGIQLEQYKLKVAIFNNQNEKIATYENVPFLMDRDARMVEPLYEMAQQLIDESGIAPEKLLGVGISMPGLVSSEEGKNFTYFLNEEEPESLEEMLTRKFDKPVYILNDAKSACLAEFTFSQTVEKNNFLVISMDWGIGLGIVVDGKIHQGSTGFAGEFGHIPLIEDGLLCHCGKRGCLETMASGVAAVRLAREGIAKGQNTILRELSDHELENLDPKTVIDAANKGDQFAINILSEIGMNLGKGIAILIQIFNPELVILEGKFAAAKQFITVPIQQSINTYCMAQLREKTKISLSTLGEDCVLLGSVATVMDNIFRQEKILAKKPEGVELV